jgi:hypoxanthine phosphoribosyltransferase
MTLKPSSDRPEVIIDAETIRNRVTEMGRQITEDYRGRDLTLLAVLNGSFVFAADLARAIDLPLRVEFIGVRSYGSRETTSGVVEITMDVKYPLNDRHVLMVEDIVDTGLTVAYLRENLKTRRPASLKLAALLYKPARAERAVEIDYLGFTVPDRFVVGYGLDAGGYMRNIPYIGAAVDPRGRLGGAPPQERRHERVR